MDFPTFEKNATVPTEPIEVTPPADTTGATASERFVKQQWKDVAASDLPTAHPLSLNRDSQYVTDDPYDV